MTRLNEFGVNRWREFKESVNIRKRDSKLVKLSKISTHSGLHINIDSLHRKELTKILRDIQDWIGKGEYLSKEVLVDMIIKRIK